MKAEARNKPISRHAVAPVALAVLTAVLTAALAGALVALVGLARAEAPATGPAGKAIESFFEEEVRRFTRLAASGIPAYQVEAAQGFYYLKHHRGEAALLPLAGHEAALVRLEAVKALGVCGRREGVEALIERLADADWEIRANARDALERMTAAGPFADRAAGRAWLRRSNWRQKQAVLLKQLAGKDKARVLSALRAIRFVGDRAAEDEVLRRGPHLGGEAVRRTCLALERVGTRKALPFLIRMGPHLKEACWALAEIGGPGAEEALLKALKRWGGHRVDAMVNVDRIGSTRCGPHLPMLLQTFGLVIFRAQTDDLQFEPTAFQRAAAKLILRTGQSQKVVDLILAECEKRRKDADTPPHLRKILAGMRTELAPGFVRSDGLTVAQPLAALPHIIRDRRFAPRLIALLDHPAFLVRIYAAEALAALKAPEGVEPILKVVRTPYGFPDPTNQVSGKHFDRSRFVRWRGYLCIALGKLGGETARTNLEALADDPASYRDIRYGSVVGLRFLRSPKSLPVLERIVRRDIIWEVRREARAAVRDIELARRLAAVGSKAR